MSSCCKEDSKHLEKGLQVSRNLTMSQSKAYSPSLKIKVDIFRGTSIIERVHNIKKSDDVPGAPDQPIAYDSLTQRCSP